MKHIHLTFLALLFSFISFGAISGPGSLCAGSNATYTETVSGGIWSSSNTAVITIGSASGIATAVAAGTANIIYTTGSGTTTLSVTINSSPTVYTLFWGGSGYICAGNRLHLFLSGSQPGFNYSLFRNGVPVSAMPGTGSSLDFGIWAPMPGDVFFVIMTDPVTGCNRTATASPLTVLPTPTIAGPSAACVGSTATLTSATSGGTWSSSNPSIAAVGSTGIVSGVAIGSATITYTMPSGCYATAAINVINLVSPISGSSVTCVSATNLLTDASGGGTWSSSNISRAIVGSSSGIVSGISAGTATITYTVGSCGYVVKPITVNNLPASITGITGICAGSISTLRSATGGGIWSSANTAVASVGTTSGIVLGVSGGTTSISYTVAGCSRTTSMIIDPTPAISGASAVCVSDTIMLSSTIPGSWTSSNPTIASITSAGVVTGNIPGSAIITCNSFATGCVSTRTITVSSSCSGTPAGGTANATYTNHCSGTADTLYLTGASTTCGIIHQWQYSTDSFSWYSVPGGSFDKVVVHPQVRTWYRCRLTCYSTALFTYSSIVRVNVYNSITSHPIYNNPSITCTGPDFQVNTCGVGLNTKIKTYYGDGTSDITSLHSTSADSSCHADIFHNYEYPGTYTVKQVLYDGTVAQDSAETSVTYNYCRTLPVFFYLDNNSNCLQDAGDAYIYHPVSVEVDSNGVHIDTITASNGFFYRALGTAGTAYRFRVIAHDTGLQLSCPATGIIYDTITTYTNTYDNNFIGFTCTASSAINLGIINSTQTCASTFARGSIDVNNVFCTGISAVVTMNINPKYSFGSSYPAPFSVSGNVATWHINPLTTYASIPYGQHISYSLIRTGAALTAGDTIYTNYRITPTSGDIDTTNNFNERIDTIRASYDPNNIIVHPGGTVIPCTPLKYTINFENTGNDTARNIAVIDTLPDNINPKTIKLVSSSAPANIAIIKWGSRTIVKFDFPDINLPDSSHHDRCHGQVVFTANAKSGLTDGTIITNRAAIYFDYNLPVLTNYTGVTIGISPITGPSTICRGSQAQFNNLSLNGTWARSNSTASVSILGLTTGLSAGSNTISYTLSNSCVTRSATKAITINPTVTPAVTIAPEPGTGDTVCEGSIAAYSAAPVNGGTSPTYQWKVNGVSSGTGTTFTASSPANGDIVSVKLTSNANCPSPDTAVGQKVLNVVAPYIPPVTLNAYPGLFISHGMADTFVATVTGSGPEPTYQWLVNGTPVPGATSDTFITSTLANNDSITCITTGTDLCKMSTFNSFIVTVGNLGVREQGQKAQMVIFPNPNNGTFTVKGITGDPGVRELDAEVINAVGQLVHRQKLIPDNGMIDEVVQPDINLPAGMYILNLHSGAWHIIFRFVVQ